MSTSDWCDLNKDCAVFKLLDMCHNPKCICQKQITFTAKQFQHDGGSIRSKLQKHIQGTQTAWNIFPEPGLKLAAPLISAAIAAKTKNSQSAQITKNILKSLTGGKILSLTDLHGNGLRTKIK